MGKYFHFAPAQPAENPFAPEDLLPLRYPYLNNQTASSQRPEGANADIDSRDLLPTGRSTHQQDNEDGSIVRGTPYYESAVATAKDLNEQKQNPQRHKRGRGQMVHDMKTMTEIPEMGRQAARDYMQKFSNDSSSAMNARVRLAKPIHSELGAKCQAANQEHSNGHTLVDSNSPSGFNPLAMATAKGQLVQMGPRPMEGDQDELTMDVGAAAKTDSVPSKAAAAQQKTATKAKISKATAPKPAAPKPKAARKPRTPKTTKTASDIKHMPDNHSGLPGPARLRRLTPGNMYVDIPAAERPTTEKRRPGRPRRNAVTAAAVPPRKDDDSGTITSGGSGSLPSAPATGNASTESDVTNTIHEGSPGTHKIDFQVERLPTPQPQTTPSDANTAKYQEGQQLPTPMATPAYGKNTLKRPVGPQANAEANSGSPTKRQRIIKEQPNQPIANLGGGDTSAVEEGLQDGDLQGAQKIVEIAERPVIGTSLNGATKTIEKATENQNEEVLLLTHPKVEDAASEAIMDQ